MARILQKGTIDKLPVAELTATLDLFLEPVLVHLPEKRLREVGKLAVQGVLGGQSPLVTQMARGVAREDETVWPMAKRLYRFIWNPRFSHRDLLKGLYGLAQRAVALGGRLGSRELREALHRGLGGCLHGHEEHTAWARG